jgi:hypothetical protein
MAIPKRKVASLSPGVRLISVPRILVQTDKGSIHGRFGLRGVTKVFFFEKREECIVGHYVESAGLFVGRDPTIPQVFVRDI